MSWRASAYVKSELLASRVTKSEKMLLYSLAESYGDKTRYASPSISHLAAWSLMSERQARRCLTDLTDPERKILYIVGSRVGGRGKSTKYGFVELLALDGKGDSVAPFRVPEEHLSAEKEDRASTERGTGRVEKEDRASTERGTERVEKEDIAVSAEPYNRKYEPYNRKNEPEELTSGRRFLAATEEKAEQTDDPPKEFYEKLEGWKVPFEADAVRTLWRVCRQELPSVTVPLLMCNLELAWDRADREKINRPVGFLIQACRDACHHEALYPTKVPRKDNFSSVGDVLQKLIPRT